MLVYIKRTQLCGKSQMNTGSLSIQETPVETPVHPTLRLGVWSSRMYGALGLQGAAFRV